VTSDVQDGAGERVGGLGPEPTHQPSAYFLQKPMWSCSTQPSEP
jgi:hypothetical protein